MDQDYVLPGITLSEAGKLRLNAQKLIMAIRAGKPQEVIDEMEANMHDYVIELIGKKQAEIDLLRDAKND